MDTKIALLISVVYGIIETLEKFGLPKRYAHILTLPLGIIGSYLFLEFSSLPEHILYGIFIGLTSVGTCDTLCNIADIIKNTNNQ